MHGMTFVIQSFMSFVNLLVGMFFGFFVGYVINPFDYIPNDPSRYDLAHPKVELLVEAAIADGVFKCPEGASEPVRPSTYVYEEEEELTDEDFIGAPEPELTDADFAE